MDKPLKVDIWSDIACPFCYIGKHQLEKASELAGVPLDVTYRSYQLDPHVSDDEERTVIEMLAEKYNASTEQIMESQERVRQMAEDVGVGFVPAGQRAANTDLGHQLIHFAAEHGKQAEMKDRLFRDYFTDGGHVGRSDRLVDMAEEVGLDREAAAEALESGRYAAAVEADVAAARELGVQGVPFFLFEDKYGVSGARGVEAFAGALRQVAAEVSAE